MDTFNHTPDWWSDTWEEILTRSLIHSGDASNEFLARKQAKELIRNTANHYDLAG